MIYLYIAIGGVAGAIGRYAVGLWMAAPPGSFPWATLLINVSGSLLLGFLMRALPAWGTPMELRALLTVGFCGSFTTFSTFGYETLTLAERGAPGMAAAYVAASLLLGLAGVALGLALAPAV